VGVSAVGVAPAPLRHALASVARSMDELPSISQQLDVLMSQVRAQRLAIQAVEAELAALDDQLAVLERSLAPIAAWSHQSARLRSALADVLDQLPPEEQR
jgi:septal ring factor EnvC (AmiA/AmiB activator)